MLLACWACSTLLLMGVWVLAVRLRGHGRSCLQVAWHCVGPFLCMGEASWRGRLLGRTMRGWPVCRGRCVGAVAGVPGVEPERCSVFTGVWQARHGWIATVLLHERVHGQPCAPGSVGRRKLRLLQGLGMLMMECLCLQRCPMRLARLTVPLAAARCIAVPRHHVRHAESLAEQRRDDLSIERHEIRPRREHEQGLIPRAHALVLVGHLSEGV